MDGKQRDQNGSTDPTPTMQVQAGVCVCVYYCRTCYKAVRWGGRRRVEDMFYERRRAEACVDESAHHALEGIWNAFAKWNFWIKNLNKTQLNFLKQSSQMNNFTVFFQFFIGM